MGTTLGFLATGFVVLVLVGIAISLVLVAIVGAIAIFRWALEWGFLGAIAYVAAWVVMFPVMAIISFAAGAYMWWADRQAEKHPPKLADFCDPADLAQAVAEERERQARFAAIRRDAAHHSSISAS